MDGRPTLYDPACLRTGVSHAIECYGSLRVFETALLGVAVVIRVMTLIWHPRLGAMLRIPKDGFDNGRSCRRANQ
jgi:hypothetical protein